MDERIASNCLARSVCSLHSVACDVTCAGYSELQYQLSLSNIPVRYRSIRGQPANVKTACLLFNDSGTPFAQFKAVAQQVLDGGQQGVYLWSNSTGTGKSTAATALAVEYVVKRVGQALRAGHGNITPYAYYTSAPQFLEAVKRMYSDEDAMVDVTDVQERMVNAELLVFDDVGITYASESVQERLLSILEQRYDRPTLWSSNCSLPQLEERLGGRIVSRIYGSTVEVHLRGLDHRKERGDL